MNLFGWLIVRKHPPPLGYSLQKIGRDEYEYREGDRSIRYQVDMESKPGPDRRIHKVLIQKWEPPHENDPLTNEDRDRIVARTCADFERQGLTYAIEE